MGPGVSQRLKGQWGKQDGVVQGLAEEREARVPCGHVPQQSRQDLHAFEGLAVGTQRGFEAAAAGDVGVVRGRQEMRGKGLVVLCAQDVGWNPRQGRARRCGVVHSICLARAGAPPTASSGTRWIRLPRSESSDCRAPSAPATRAGWRVHSDASGPGRRRWRPAPRRRPAGRASRSVHRTP